MPDRKISELVDGVTPQDTDEFVVARAGDNNKLEWSALADAATVGNVALTLDGNTAGALALVSSGTLTLAGGNNITVSQAGNAVTISGADAAGAQTAISGLANSETTYTSGTVELVQSGAITIASNAGQQFVFSVDPQSVQPETQSFIGGIQASDATYTSGTVIFTGSQAATVRSGTGQRVIIDVPAQSVQPETQTFIAGISASDTLYTSGNVRFTGVGGGVTVSSNTGQRVDISVAAQSVQPETQTFIAGISASDTLYTSGNVRFTGVGGGITVSTNTGQRVDLSVAAQSVQPETQTFIGGISASNTLYTSGSVRFTGSQAVTVRSGTGQLVVIDAPAQTTQTQGILSAGVSTGGNTAGNTTVNTGSRFVLVASGNATASQATAAGASTVTISVGTQTIQTQGIPALGVSTGGNTAGDTGVNSGTRLVLAGGANITLSQATAANATTISVVGGAGGGGNFSGGVSNLGNTAGATGITGTQNVFVGSGVVSLSQTTGANGGTISILAPATSSLSATGGVSISTNGSTISIGVPMTTVDMWLPWQAAERVTGQIGQASLHVQPYPIDAHVQFDRVVFPVQYSQATNSTLTVTLSAWVGLYTRNASTLSLLHSGSGTFSINGSGTASSANNSGPRNMSIPWTTTVNANQYWLGFVSRTTTAGANASISNFMLTQQNSIFSGMMGVAVTATAQYRLGLGIWSATTSGMPSSVGFSHITGSGVSGQRPPLVWLLSQTV
jgi:hypothetical protein